jgi:tRNA-dihydrouridine synthase 1
VRILKESLDVPVVSNGNVRCYDDVVKNLETTGADGIMVGEGIRFSIARLAVNLWF